MNFERFWCRLLRELAGPNKDTVMVGRSHAIHASDHLRHSRWLVWLVNPANQERLGAVGGRSVRGQISLSLWAPMPNTDPEDGSPTCQRLVSGPRHRQPPRLIGRRSACRTTQTPWLWLALPGAYLPLKSAKLQRTDVLEVREKLCQGARKGSSASHTAQTPFAASGISGLARRCCAATPWPPWRTWPSGMRRDIKPQLGGAN